MFTQSFEELSIKTNGNKLIKITEKILNFVNRSKISNGILNISILHTSASLIIQENADDDVQKDILNFRVKCIHPIPEFSWTPYAPKEYAEFLVKLKKRAMNILLDERQFDYAKSCWKKMSRQERTQFMEWVKIYGEI